MEPGYDMAFRDARANEASHEEVIHCASVTSQRNRSRTINSDMLAASAVGRIGARRVRAMRGPIGVIRRFCLLSSKMNVRFSGTAICFAL
jgi:hypothetical protein